MYKIVKQLIIKYEGALYRISFDEKGLPRNIEYKNKEGSWVLADGGMFATVTYYGMVVEEIIIDETPAESPAEDPAIKPNNLAEDAKKAVKKGILYGFIPNHLEIKGYPQLRVFPHNILFAKFKVENGKTIMGTAEYKPVLRSLRKDDQKLSMRFNNAHSGQSWILIEYDMQDNSYSGKKYVNDKFVGMADGKLRIIDGNLYEKEWHLFFTQLTALGLSNGEECSFETVD